MKFKGFLSALAAALALTGCSSAVSHTTRYGTAGAVAGAGTGAIVGSMIANGDIAMSSLFGAGVGLAGGMLVGYWLDYQERARVHLVDAEIARNERSIKARQAEIDALYRRIGMDSQRDELDQDSFDTRVYQGPTIGVYNK